MDSDHYLIFKRQDCKFLPEHKQTFLEHNYQLPLCTHVNNVCVHKVKPVRPNDTNPKRFVGIHNNPAQMEFKHTCAIDAPYKLKRSHDC